MIVPASQPRFDTRQPTDGWYTYAAGEEVRCPGQDSHKKGGFTGRCNKYLMTVATATVVFVRPEVRLHEGIERRQRPRSSKRCERCSTALQIEMSLAERVA